MLPELIQGGMGVAVLSWALARAVSALGQGRASYSARDVVEYLLGVPGDQASGVA